MGMNPHANGGELLVPLVIPHFHDHDSGSAPRQCRSRIHPRSWRRFAGRDEAEPTAPEFRSFGPDETASNRLDAVYEVAGKEWMARM